MAWNALPAEIMHEIVGRLDVDRQMSSMMTLIHVRTVVALSRTCRAWHTCVSEHRPFWLGLFRVLSMDQQNNFMMQLIVEYIDTYHHLLRDRLFALNVLSQLFSVHHLFYLCADRFVQKTYKCFLHDLGERVWWDAEEMQGAVDAITKKGRPAVRSGASAYDATEAGKVGHLLRSESITTYTSLPNIVYTTALDAAARAMNAHFADQYTLVAELRRVHRKDEERCDGRPHYSFDTMVPLFSARTLWYDVVRVCGSAAIGYATLWIEHYTSKMLGEHGLDVLGSEIEGTVTMTRDFKDAQHVCQVHRLWNARVVAEQDDYAKRRYRQRRDDDDDDDDDDDVYTCANMNCEMLVTDKNLVSPLGNACSGVYCSSWCCFDDAVRGAVIRCGHPQCAHPIRLGDAIGLTRHNRVNAIEWKNPFRHWPVLHDKVNRRIDHLSKIVRAPLASHKLYISPQDCDRPPHMDGDEWSRCRIHSGVAQWHANSVEPPCLGYYRPAQAHCMPRVFFDCAQRRRPMAFCSQACREGHRRGKNSPWQRQRDSCLNPLCNKVFEAAYAAASMECVRVVFIDSSGKRVLRGYVCDLLCREQFLRARCGPATRAKAAKRARAPNATTTTTTTTGPHAKKRKMLK